MYFTVAVNKVNEHGLSNTTRCECLTKLMTYVLAIEGDILSRWTHTHTHIQTDRHTHTCTHTYIRTYRHAHAHAHTHTHTHTLMPQKKQFQEAKCMPGSKTFLHFFRLSCSTHNGELFKVNILYIVAICSYISFIVTKIDLVAFCFLWTSYFCYRLANT